MISCLTVTQEGREESLLLAIHDFVRQTFTDKELVIVHDGNDDFNQLIADAIGIYPSQKIALHKIEQGHVLGELRNISIELANGDIICQWDDDDRYHSERLELQYQHFIEQQADFSFFTDQLHYFVFSKELFWDNWDLQQVPAKDTVIQGSMMAYKNKMPSYPALERGEDTAVTFQVFSEGAKVAKFSNYGHLYLYQFNGNNTWGFEHHGLTSSLKRYLRDDIEKKLELVTDALSDFAIKDHEISMPHDTGVFKLVRKNDIWSHSETLFE